MPTALITGAAKRIGKIIALALAKEGWDLILHYNFSEREVSAVQMLAVEMGVSAILWQCDFMMLDKVEQFKPKNNLDLLINNAAIFQNDHINDFIYQNINNHLKINVIVPMLLTKMFSFYSQNARDPNVINILDYQTKTYPHNFFSYHISKNALAYFTKIAAENLAPCIRVNGIALGQTIKNPNQSIENFNRAINSSKLKKIVSEKNLVDTLHYLIHNQNITGSIISLGN